MNKPVGNLKPEAEVTAPHVLQAINAVMAELSRDGISKARNNAQQGYKFRGIDDVYNALAPVLSRNNLVITPKCLSRQKEVVTTAKGGTLFYVTVDMEFELASALDGSTKTAQMFGEAMDSGDKATNKAMSAAYKYMAMQEFCIPTEGDNDADATTHEVVARPAEPPPIFIACKAAIDMCEGEPELNRWKADNAKAFDKMTPAELGMVKRYWQEKVKASRAAPPVEQPRPSAHSAGSLGIGDDEIPF